MVRAGVTESTQMDENIPEIVIENAQKHCKNNEIMSIRKDSIEGASDVFKVITRNESGEESRFAVSCILEVWMEMIWMGKLLFHLSSYDVAGGIDFTAYLVLQDDTYLCYVHLRL